MTEYEAILAQSDLLFDMNAINQALDKLAQDLVRDYADKNPVLLSVMNGAVMTAGHLLPRLTFKLEIDYIHASRYGDKTVGGNLVWRAEPTVDLESRHVLLIEDIYDEGITVSALRKYCLEAGALSVRCVTLLYKDRAQQIKPYPEYIGLTVPERYVFGFGMDVEGFWRNIPAIYAIKES